MCARFRGFVLRDVQLFDTRTGKRGTIPVLCVSEVRLTHSLLPLLLRKLLIRDMAFVDPVIMLTGRQGRPRRPAVAMSEELPPLQMSFLPRSLRVSGGQGSVCDCTRASGA